MALLVSSPQTFEALIQALQLISQLREFGLEYLELARLHQGGGLSREVFVRVRARTLRTVLPGAGEHGKRGGGATSQCITEHGHKLGADIGPQIRQDLHQGFGQSSNPLNLRVLAHHDRINERVGPSRGWNADTKTGGLAQW